MKDSPAIAADFMNDAAVWEFEVSLMQSNQCGLFDFMAHSAGIKVLHPGGRKSTDALLSNMSIQNDSVVLDLACGTGTSSFHIHKQCKCTVKGIDISHDLIAIANKDLVKQGGQGRVSFEVADALKLPFPDNHFDAVVSQAFFILIDGQIDALNEIVRVLKPGGCFGSIELSWFKEIDQNGFNELATKTCNDFIPRVKLFDEWDHFYRSKKFECINIQKLRMDSGMIKMVRSEGFRNFLRIMIKMMKSSSVRRKMMAVQKTFKKYRDYLGYGIYCYRKL